MPSPSRFQSLKIRDLNSVLRFSQIWFLRSLPAQNCSTIWVSRSWNSTINNNSAAEHRRFDLLFSLYLKITYVPMSKTLLFLGSGLRRFRAASPKLIEFKLSGFPTENGDGICRLHQDFKIRDLNSVLRFSQIWFPRSLPAQNVSASAKPKLIEFKLSDFPTENGDGICRLHFLAEMERFELSRQFPDLHP